MVPLDKRKRDVVELSDGILDFAGWDLRKTLRLFCKANPVLYEWLVAPKVYRCSGSFAGELRDLAAQYYSKKAVSSHYLHMAEGNFRRNIAGKGQVRLKKYLSVLRHLVNINWLIERDEMVPMELEETLRGITIPESARKSLNALILEKKNGPELGTGERMPELDKLAEELFERARNYCAEAPVVKAPLEKIDRLFRKTLDETWS